MWIIKKIFLHKSLNIPGKNYENIISVKESHEISPINQEFTLISEEEWNPVDLDFYGTKI